MQRSSYAKYIIIFFLLVGAYAAAWRTQMQPPEPIATGPGGTGQAQVSATTPDARDGGAVPSDLPENSTKQQLPSPSPEHVAEQTAMEPKQTPPKDATQSETPATETVAESTPLPDIYLPNVTPLDVLPNARRASLVTCYAFGSRLEGTDQAYSGDQSDKTIEAWFSAAAKTFSFRRLGTGQGPTLLVIGGIQGDEPGGFSAAALLATHYTIHSGSVWVVPNLNMPSILARSRGLFGDMNRKFAELSANDPEYSTIALIKKILLSDQVDVILNLHDGSGFYRPYYIDPKKNPQRWGQSVIIDQASMEASRFSSLEAIAQEVSADVNKALIKPEHQYHIRNTRTALGDKEMEKTLSYFAVCNGKPAFGIEASKEFTTEFRSYYHVLVIESFMRQMGIDFERSFSLTPASLAQALNSNLVLTAFNNRLVLPLEDLRPQINMLPFKKGEEPNPLGSKPLLALIPENNIWRVAYGNRTLTRIEPIYMDFDESLSNVTMQLDSEEHTVPIGRTVTVAKSFIIDVPKGYRVNAIGAQKEQNGTEAGVLLQKRDFIPRFSLDKAGTTFRVEIYKGQAFAGMVLVKFGNQVKVPQEPLTAIKGHESEFGF